MLSELRQTARSIVIGTLLEANFTLHHGKKETLVTADSFFAKTVPSEKKTKKPASVTPLKATLTKK